MKRYVCVLSILCILGFFKVTAVSAEDYAFCGIHWSESFETIITKLRNTGKFDIDRTDPRVRFRSAPKDITLLTNLAFAKYSCYRVDRIALSNRVNIKEVHIDRKPHVNSDVQECVLYMTDKGELIAYRIDMDETQEPTPSTRCSFKDIALKHGEPIEVCEGLYKWSGAVSDIYYRQKSVRSLKYAELYFVNNLRLAELLDNAGIRDEAEAKEVEETPVQHKENFAVGK